MEFEWDDAKSAANLILRGLSFGDAAIIFDAPTFSRLSTTVALREKSVSRPSDKLTPKFTS